MICINFKHYRKFIVALVGAAVIGLSTAFGANSPYVVTLIAVGTAFGVYQAPNNP